VLCLLLLLLLATATTATATDCYWLSYADWANMGKVMVAMGKGMFVLKGLI